MKDHRRRRAGKPRVSRSVLDRINPNAAGIDCGSAEHFVAVPPDRDPMPVQSFPTFTSDLHRLADWLTACHVTSVAMEATGVVLDPGLRHPRGPRHRRPAGERPTHQKRPGTKERCVRLRVVARLHSVGLLRGSFRPTEAIVALRAYVRHRQSLVESAATYVHRMQKALVQMNLQLPLVVSDITGVTGLKILRDIVAGRHDPQHLASHRDYRCHASHTEIQAALTGHFRPEYPFVLQQNLELFDVCQTQLAGCDRAIDAHLQGLTATREAPPTPLPAPRVTRKRADNEPHCEIRTPLHQLTGGVDLTQIDGIAPYTALKLIAEIGTDMHRWTTEKHFTSWLTLAPKNKVSGGRLLSSRTEPSANRAAVILRIAAMTLGRGQTALGAFYRRLAGRTGKTQAITATARKLAILVYRALKGDLVYRDPGAHVYDLQQRTRVLRRLRQRAATLGFALVNRDTGEILDTALA